MALTSDNNIDIAAEQPRLIDAALTMRIASAILVLHTGTCTARLPPHPTPTTCNCIMWKYSRAAFTFLIRVRRFATHRSPVVRILLECRCMPRKKSERDVDFADALLAKKLAEAVGRHVIDLREVVKVVITQFNWAPNLFASDCRA